MKKNRFKHLALPHFLLLSLRRPSNLFLMAKNSFPLPFMTLHVYVFVPTLIFYQISQPPRPLVPYNINNAQSVFMIFFATLCLHKYDIPFLEHDYSSTYYDSLFLVYSLNQIYPTQSPGFPFLPFIAACMPVLRKYGFLIMILPRVKSSMHIT